MSCTSKFVYSKDYSTYRFSDDHPFNQMRVELTYDLLEEMEALNKTDLISPRYATEEELALFHSREYIDAVKKASVGNLDEEDALEFGIGTEDTPMFEGMHEAASLIVGSTLSAIDEVMEGRADHTLNLGGGLHHGFERKASGFCIYNDGAVGIKYLQKKYNQRVLYIDTDAHHGDGVQWAFYGDPDVCTLSIHETGRYLFPGTGNVNERGLKEGYGYSFNLPIDAFTEDESFLHVYETAFRKVTAYFEPDIIVSQNGADAHFYDPLTHLCSTMNIYERIPELTHELAHKHCNGKWVALGGGGYDIWRVVPRAWSQLWKVMNDQTPFQGDLPNSWISKWEPKAPFSLPRTWHDPEGSYKEIPRKPEITEKNDKILKAAMQFINNQLHYN